MRSGDKHGEQGNTCEEKTYMGCGNIPEEQGDKQRIEIYTGNENTYKEQEY